MPLVKVAQAMPALFFPVIRFQACLVFVGVRGPASLADCSFLRTGFLDLATRLLARPSWDSSVSTLNLQQTFEVDTLDAQVQSRASRHRKLCTPNRPSSLALTHRRTPDGLD